MLSVLSVHFSQLSIQQSAYGSMVITLIESVAFEMGVWAKAQRFFRGTTGTKLKTDDIVKDTNASVKETPAGVRKRTPRVAKKLN